ncbi:hypothetical protein [Mesonia sp. HuA40]|uniref:hypothetical protein n=1 Tax=Mesonia sp. HuA40 TaxID=2602761 RepID=UPI0011CBD300|nr:hypothetical protein [Mesonia sp. HuA40]TXK73946.1 hypothetical protein FT993_03545 [Mesonia sp. HuA40]
MRLFLVPKNLTTDPNNKQGQIGIFHSKDEDIITLKFPDDQLCNYFEEALIEVEDDVFYPEFIFQTQNNFILSLIAQGKIDAKELAKKELERRYLDVHLNRK